MTTKVLTENQINGMKENGVTVICNGCGVEAAKDKTLPTTSWLISCKNEEKQWSDIVMGSRVAVFDSYYDAFGKNVIQRMDWTCLLYTSPSPRDVRSSRMPSSA